VCLADVLTGDYLIAAAVVAVPHRTGAHRGRRVDRAVAAGPDPGSGARLPPPTGGLPQLDVGAELAAENVDVERQRSVLVVHLHGDALDTCRGPPHVWSTKSDPRTHRYWRPRCRSLPHLPLAAAHDRPGRPSLPVCRLSVRRLQPPPSACRGGGSPRAPRGQARARPRRSGRHCGAEPLGSRRRSGRSRG